MTRAAAGPTRIHVAAEGGRCTLQGGLLVARRLPAPAGHVRIALVAASALLLAGDAVLIEVVVDGPVRVDLVDISGTVAHAMRGGRASWDVEIALRGGAVLTWHGEPFIVSDDADVVRRTRVSIDDASLVLLRETVVLGRSGEQGGHLVSHQEVRTGGVPLLVESLDLGPAARSGWLRLGDTRCLDSITLVGARLPPGHDVLQLEGAGSIRRRLLPQAHLSDQPAAWAEAVAGLPDLRA